MAKPGGARGRWSARASLRRAARRFLRRLTTRVRPPAVKVVYDPGYERAIAGVPMDPLRADKVLAFLVDEGLIRREEISRPRPVALKNVLLVHSERYLESLQRPETVTAILGTPASDAEALDAFEVQRLQAGGTVQATRLALASGAVAVNLGGGLHHAGPERGEGFCLINDVAIAIRRLRAGGFTSPILVIDLDLHDGNGTRTTFAADTSVHTYSVHNADWGDTGAVASTSVALGPGIADEPYLATLVKGLPPLLDAFRPGLVLFLAGCDVASDDRLGDWKITADGVLARDRLVVELVQGRSIPLVVVLAGGYGEQAWRYSARFLSWLLAGVALEPPDNEELTLVRFRQVKAMLDPGALTETAGGFELTEEDLVGILPGIPRQTRLLGFFSPMGVELLLERFGILEQLRARGFRRPSLGLELDHPLGQTLRIWGDDERRELLIEVRIKRSNRLVPGLELLVVEWMLLQNPREAFSPARPALPGQSHPGLGLLGELFGWLVVVGETLELDGLAFLPSHYHVAALAHRFVRFLAVEDEAMFTAVQRLLADLPLEQAAVLVDRGGVIDSNTGSALRWQPSPMVVAISQRLEAKLDDPARAAALAERTAELTRIVRRNEVSAALPTPPFTLPSH